MLYRNMIVMILFLFHSVFALKDGVNLQPSYYNNGDVTFGWDLMKKYSQIKSVRIEIEPDKVSQAWNWIRQAVNNGYEVVATYHNYAHLGSDDVNHLLDAAKWWSQHYSYLNSAAGFTINLSNEWGSHNQSPQSYANAYNQAINIVRTVYSGYLIIDIPGWGQETHTAAQAAPLIHDKAIVFSAHLYPGGWNQVAGRNLQPDDMNVLANSGRPCVVGEYGTHSGEGPVNVIALVNRAKQIGFWAVYAWAWNGDGGDLNMVTPTWSNNAKSNSYSESSYFWSVIGPL